MFVDEDHSKLPTLYWLHKLHKQPYKLRFIANSSACTTTELSILLTSCLTAIKNHAIKYCTTVYERNGKKLFWYIKNSGGILNKLKSRGFLASGLSTYDFSTLYSTLPHNLIKEKLTELIEQTFNREGSLYLTCNDKNAFLLLNNLNDINCGHVRKCVMRSIIFWTIYEGCSNMNASSSITFITCMLRQNVIPFWKELFVAFKMAPNIKKHLLYFSSYRCLYKGHSYILKFF